MPKVYLAGPMRGYPDFNFPAFDKAAALGRSLGWDVISPADLDRKYGYPIEEVPVGGGTPSQCRIYARRDTNAILGMRAEDGDAIALLPGWENSVGTTAELALANWVKLVVVDATTFKFYRSDNGI